MAKPKSPLLSLGAQGTIADTLTYQKRGREHIVREKPIPTDPYSLAQAYQRWDYRDYAYLWTLLSNADKQIYRTKASKYHITGFSLWMREHLKTLPDIAGRWHLDEKGGAIAYDSSKNNNNGVIIGATPVSGLIDGAYHFDGINDLIEAPHNPTQNPTSAITLEIRVKIPFAGTWRGLFSKMLVAEWWLNGYYLVVQSDGRIHFNLTDIISRSLNRYDDGDWHTYHATWEKPGTLDLFVDGVEVAYHTQGTRNTDILPSTAPFRLGKYHDTGWLLGDLDEASLYNRRLDHTERQRHLKRRYPP